jgi:hypothetical protein
MKIKKFDEAFNNRTEGDYLPQEMAFADLMSDADTEDRFDVTRYYHPDQQPTYHYKFSKLVIYDFEIKIGKWVNDGLRDVKYTNPDELYEDFKKRNDFIEEIYIACKRTQDEYPDVKIDITESWSVSSTFTGNCLIFKIKMFIR